MVGADAAGRYPPPDAPGPSRLAGESTAGSASAGSRLAREVRPGALHRGRFYHVRHKRLYAAIDQADNRNRRPAPIGALASRLMLLDLVLDDPSRLWLGMSQDTRLYVTELDSQSRLDDVDLPHLRYGAGRDKRCGSSRTSGRLAP